MREVFRSNPAVRVLEGMRTLATLSVRDMASLPRRPYAADAHIHSFTKAFGLPERRLGAWLEQGAVDLSFRLRKPPRGRCECTLRLIAALTDWRKRAVPCRITLNGWEVFQGNLFVENVCRGWPAIYYPVADEALRTGVNVLRIEKSGDPAQTLVLNRADLLAFDWGGAFRVVSAPALVQTGEPFLVALRTPDIARTEVRAPSGWRQLGEPVNLLDEPGLYGFRFIASECGADVPITFRLGAASAAAAVRLVSDATPEPQRVIVGLQGDDIRHDRSAEMRIVLKSLLLSDLGNFFCFRPTYGRSYYELADAAEVDRWIHLIETGEGYFSSCAHQVGGVLGATSKAVTFERMENPRYVGRMTHEPYLIIQPQWQPPRLRRARDMAQAAAAYRAHIQQQAHPDGRTSIGEPSHLGMYLRHCGFQYIYCEPVANFTLLTAAVRGAARGTPTQLGYHLAPDWYFGWPNDARKNRRLECALYTGFLAGGKAFYLENAAFGTNANTRMYMDDPFIARNRDILREFYAAVRLHPRRGEPERRFAAVFGRANANVWLHDDVIPELLDSKHAGGAGDTTGSNWAEPLWGKWPDNGSRECMRAVDAVAPPVPFRADRRSVLKMFTGTPFGQFDMVQADFETLSEYALLFYTGFNLMTAGDLRRLAQYVRGGGTLVLAAAHLNATAVPTKPVTWQRGPAAQRLIGAELGAKAARDCDGAALLPVKRLHGAEVLERMPSGAPLVLEHCLGKGRVVFLTAADYKALGAMLPKYQRIIRERVAAIPTDFGIRGTKKVQCAVYRDGDRVTLHLLNTAWDDGERAERFQVVLWGEARPFALKPCRFTEITSVPTAAFCADTPLARVEVEPGGGDAVRLRITALAPAAIQCIVRKGGVASVRDAQGKAVRVIGDAFRVPLGAGQVYDVCMTE